MEHDFTKKYCSQCKRSIYVVMPYSNKHFDVGEKVLECYASTPFFLPKFLDRNSTNATTCRHFVPEQNPNKRKRK